MNRILPTFCGLALAVLAVAARAQGPYHSSEDFARYASKLRENALVQLEPRVIVPTTSRTGLIGGRYPWKNSIVTTTFWVGESASANNPVHNRSSSWDLDWEGSYGGFDTPDPTQRRDYVPMKFSPGQNPFYFALPYNDVTRGTTKPEARVVIPWFRQVWEREGKSVCKDRWIEIRNQKGRSCYAQWSDCGPFRTDHYQYVFGNERPKPNLNRGAGLDVSPAVRDFLGLAPTDTTDWRFVEFRDIPSGPWAKWGDNNTFVQVKGRSTERVASAAPLPSRRAPERNRAPELPTVVTKSSR